MASVAGLACMSINAAQAATGTVNFTGSISASTCVVSAGGAGANPTVTLPSVAKDELKAVGAVAGRMPFGFQLTGCLMDDPGGAPAPVKKVGTHFEGGGNVTSNGRLKTTLTGVELQILNYGDTTPVMLGADVASQNIHYFDINTTAGTANLQYWVEYYAAAANPAPGALTSSVVYSLIYP
ncbi:fimbrial protein [Herminiimonas sp. KBW02]|uniref:fimbrial protein n=1 Tax=Herminiimonas sp. KBW02 TaxID=2153363 RepID=UPI001F2EB56F|nr:fimbrial protein [Herminiimonas sp. KBW02]